MSEVAHRFKFISLTTGLSLALAVSVAVLWFDPTQYPIFPVCPLHRMTGWNCPGCGGLRAVHHLLHGHWLTAFHCNPLFVTALPLLAGLVVRALVKRRELLPELKKLASPTLMFIGLAVVVLFGILRNLPYPIFAWMSP